jgi:hypothetical protein
MTKIARFLGTCLLIGSMATVAWADGGETAGVGGGPGLAPSAPTPAESTTDSPSPLTSVQNASATSVEVVNVLITWLVDSIL